MDQIRVGNAIDAHQFRNRGVIARRNGAKRLAALHGMRAIRLGGNVGRLLARNLDDLTGANIARIFQIVERDQDIDVGAKALRDVGQGIAVLDHIGPGVVGGRDRGNGRRLLGDRRRYHTAARGAWGAAERIALHANRSGHGGGVGA